MVKCLYYTGTEKCFISFDIFRKYFSYKKLKFSNLVVLSAQGSVSVNKGIVDLEVEIRSVKTSWQFCALDGLKAHCIVGMDYMMDREISLDFFKRTLEVNNDDNTC